MSMITPAVEKFSLRPTEHSPNSPLPVLLYRNVLPHPYTEEVTKNFLETNGWRKGGTFGHIPTYHFHPNTHECYGIFQGSSTMIIGRGENDKSGGMHIEVNTGDVIVLPAGTTHCSSQSQGNYRYVGVYPKDAPRYRNEYGKKPIDLAAFRKETSAVGIPTQDPVYGQKGPLVESWNDAERSMKPEVIVTAKL